MKSATHLVAVLVLAGLVVVGVGVYALGLIGYQRHTGFFAPVWDADGKGVYYMQRDTSGFIWGLGWEHFTPPASSHVTSDVFSLRHIDSRSGAVQVLETWRDSPLVGRTTKHYRRRIFNTVSASIEPAGTGLDILLKLQIRKVPRSDLWTLKDTWQQSASSAARWQQKWQAPRGVSDRSLHDGIEVIAVRGRESFPAAIVAVAADGGQRVLLKNDDFDDLYPDGIPDRVIADASWRESIERVRRYKTTRARLVAKHKAAGLSEGEAMLKAGEDMEELGLLPKRPRLVATLVKALPDGVRAFTIPPDYFTAGLFRDIATAIAEPGKLVDTGTGSYLKYYDDETGPLLKAWRNDGNDRFAIHTGGNTYLLEVRRFE